MHRDVLVPAPVDLSHVRSVVLCGTRVRIWHGRGVGYLVGAAPSSLAACDSRGRRCCLLGAGRNERDLVGQVQSNPVMTPELAERVKAAVQTFKDTVPY